MNDVLPSDLNVQILADENIPNVKDAFGRFGVVHRMDGRAIGETHVRDVDVLLVRSVTNVGRSLLRSSSVQFVGSATIGTDHVDQAYLAEQGIAFHHAPASNADSVADYVLAALLDLACRHRVRLSDRTAGVVGCGNVGRRVVERVSGLGASVLCNDPPLVDAGATERVEADFTDLETVLGEADVITLHVPLTTGGRYPTHHLIDAAALRQMKQGAWLLNTARGAVVDNSALLAALREGMVGAAALDVWESEPEPDERLIRAVDLATPHVAGYALDGKVRATRMLYNAFCDYVGVQPTWTGERALEPDARDELHCHPPDPRLSRTDWLQNLARQAYDLRADDRRMRDLLDREPDERGAYFTQLRAAYPRRREWQQQTVALGGVPVAYRPLVRRALTLQLDATPHRL